MPRAIEIDRTRAEWLVDLLEDCDPIETGTWRFEISSDLREKFGMAKYPQGANREPSKKGLEFLRNQGIPIYGETHA